LVKETRILNIEQINKFPASPNSPNSTPPWRERHRGIDSNQIKGTPVHRRTKRRVNRECLLLPSPPFRAPPLCDIHMVAMVHPRRVQAVIVMVPVRMVRPVVLVRAARRVRQKWVLCGRAATTFAYALFRYICWKRSMRLRQKYTNAAGRKADRRLARCGRYTSLQTGPANVVGKNPNKRGSTDQRHEDMEIVK
jgi:hypothetical protein